MPYSMVLSNKMKAAPCYTILLFWIIFISVSCEKNTKNHEIQYDTGDKFDELVFTKIIEARNYLTTSPPKAAQMLAAIESDILLLKTDSIIINGLLLKGSIAVINGQYDYGKKLFMQALEQSSLFNYRPGYCESIINLGQILYITGHYCEAQERFKQAAIVSSKNHLKTHEARAFNYIGKCYHTQGHFKESVIYYKKALEIAESLSDSELSIKLYLNLGKTCLLTGDFYQAMMLYLKANDKLSALTNNFIKADVFNHLGSMYLLCGQHEKSVNFHTQALSIRSSLDSPRELSLSYNNMGETLLAMGDNMSALINFQKSYDLCQACSYKKGSVKAMTNIGKVYYKIGKLDSAIVWQQKAYNESILVGYDAGIVETLLELGICFLEKNEPKSAADFFKQSEIKLEETANIELMPKLYYGLFLAAEKNEQPNQAIAYLKKYIEVNEFTHQAESNRLLAELRIAFDVERSEQDNLLLRQDNELKELNLRKRTLILWMVSLLVLTIFVLLLVAISRYRNKRIINDQLIALNIELEKANRDKDKMFSIIGHELRNPLYWFQNLTETLSQRHANMPADRLLKSLQSLDDSAKNAFHLMDNLLNWSRTQLNRISPRKDHYPLKLTIENVMQMFLPIIKQKSIEVKIQVPDGLQVYVDNDMLSCILRNLVSNAIKYTGNKGIIEVIAQADNNNFIIEIADNGIGMPLDDLQKWNSEGSINLQTGLMNEKGSGLGLKLSKEFVLLHGGDIRVYKSKYGGTSFCFSIPLQE